MKDKIGYVSPSSIPSSTANSVHVVMQCAALICQGVQLSLFANRTQENKQNLDKKISNSYGVDLSQARLFTFHSRLDKFLNLRIAIYAFFKLFVRENARKSNI